MKINYTIKQRKAIAENKRITEIGGLGAILIMITAMFIGLLV